MKSLPIDLLGLSAPELSQFVAAGGEKPFRARQLFSAIHAQCVGGIDSCTSLSKPFREKIQEETSWLAVSIASVREGADGTRKYQMRTHDGDLIESVFIPNASRAGRNTICISSQVGCAMGCTFCATAALKLKRNLSASEIVSQIYAVNRDLKQIGWKNPLGEVVPDPSDSARLIHNIVYMGMGEPLHNYDNVVRSIELLTDQQGQGYSPRRITVSTSGLVKNIVRLGNDTAVHIAISLNATTNEVRSQIMPVNAKWNIEELLAACREFPLPVRRRITFEYVMLAGINDTDDDAFRLIQLLRGIPCKVNLIPFNEHPLAPFKKPSSDRVASFKSILSERHMSVYVRSTRGDDVDAACGMLGAQKLESARSALLRVV